MVLFPMKPGDLVKDNHPSWLGRDERIGVIVENVGHNRGLGCTNKVLKVLWRDGTIGNNIWDYDLKIIKST